jgi:predicted O-methyltransferase YrrM
MKPNEIEQLMELAEGKVVLEVGSLLGFSTTCLARTAEVVHAVDPHRGYPDDNPKDTLIPFLANLEYYGVRNKVVPHIGTIQDIAPFLRAGSFDLAFIDISGHYRDTMECMHACIDLIDMAAPMCVHDYDLPGWPGVKESVDAFVKDSEMDFELVGTLAVIN